MEGSERGPGTDGTPTERPSRPPLDETELEVLRSRLGAAVSGTCPAWLSHRAEDIVQNALLQLFKTIRRSETKREFSSIYLAKAAHGAVVDEIRRLCRRKEDPADDGSFMEHAVSHRADPEDESRAREIGRGIQDCLGRLVRPRQLAVMLYLQGCSVPEAARRLGWTTKRTSNLVYRGLENLRECLAEKGMTP
jgi:RNA polymerase sigma factor (sigma-70 family)